MPLIRRSAPPSPDGRRAKHSAVPLPSGEGGAKRRVRGTAFLLLVLLGCHKESPTVAKPTDIILITIDTLRADSVGFAGNTRVKTPFLDRIASEGIVFTNAHAHNVVTLAKGR